MKCPRCQQETPRDADFCPECGARLAITCPECGTDNGSAYKFCKNCGRALGLVPAAEKDPARFASPQSYTPRHLAEKILTSKNAMEGERKQVTVLFCDIANSTELAQRLGAEPMHEVLELFFELALAEVHRYEGTINQFLGDGFMALFGAPIAHEDDARRAVLAALSIQRRLRDRPSAPIDVRGDVTWFGPGRDYNQVWHQSGRTWTVLYHLTDGSDTAIRTDSNNPTRWGGHIGYADAWCNNVNDNSFVTWTCQTTR